MLGKVFGTPETARRVIKPRSEDDDLTSGGSTTSHGSSEEERKKIIRPRSATVSASLQRSTKSDSHLKSSQSNRIKVQSELAPPEGRSRSRSFDTSSSKQEQKVDSRTTSPEVGNRTTSPEVDNRTTLPEVGNRTTSPEVDNRTTSPEVDDRTSPEVDNRMTSPEGDNRTTSPVRRRDSRPSSIDLIADSNEHHDIEKRLSDGQLEADIDKTSPNSTSDLPRSRQAHRGAQGERERKPVPKESSRSDTGRTSINQRVSPARPGSATSATSKQKRKPSKPLPTPRPLSDKPSTALKRLAEQKKEEPESKNNVQTDGVESSGNSVETNDKDIKSNHLHNGSIDGGPTSADTADTTATTTNDSTEVQSVGTSEGSPAKKKTLPVC